MLAIGAWAPDVMSSTGGISRRNAVRRLVVAVLIAGAIYWSYRHAALLIAIIVVVPVYWGWSKLSRLRAGLAVRGKSDRLK